MRDEGGKRVEFGNMAGGKRWGGGKRNEEGLRRKISLCAFRRVFFVLFPKRERAPSLSNLALSSYENTRLQQQRELSGTFQQR